MVLVKRTATLGSREFTERLVQQRPRGRQAQQTPQPPVKAGAGSRPRADVPPCPGSSRRRHAPPGFSEAAFTTSRTCGQGRG